MINMKHGDCIELMAGKPDGFWDLAIVDPPYGGNDAIELKDCKNINKHCEQVRMI